MNHIHIRRIALMGAALSFGTVIALALMCGVVYSADSGKADDTVVETSVKTDVHTNIEENTEYPISCTKLMIKNLASYDGAFYEDGSGREVMNVAALMVYNEGDSLIPYAHITVDTASDHYVFDATMIPPDACVLIPEKTGKALKETEIVDYFGWNTVIDSGRSLSVTVRETDEGSLSVKNTSSESVTDITVFHRTYIKDGNFYMGGMAFETRIPYIAPGGTVDIKPEFYTPGYSKVVYIE